MAYLYDDLMKDIDRGQPRPVYFFYGPEELRKEQAVQALIGKLVPRELRDFNLDILYGDETDAGQILDRISTLPMMAERRVVLIRDVAALSPSSKKQLPVHLKTACPHACLIMTAGQIDVSKAFYRDLRRAAQEVTFGFLKKQQIPNWIRERAREYDKSIDPQAIQMLWDGFQSNLVALDNEISKLAIYAAEREQICSEDVAAVVGELRVHTVFEFCDAVCLRNLPQSMALLTRLMEAGITPFNILWQLRERLKNLVSIGEMSKKNKSPRQIAASQRMVSFQVDKLIRQAANFDEGLLEKAFGLLYETELAVKSGQQRPKTAMTLLTYHLCRP